MFISCRANFNWGIKHWSSGSQEPTLDIFTFKIENPHKSSDLFTYLSIDDWLIGLMDWSSYWLIDFLDPSFDTRGSKAARFPAKIWRKGIQETRFICRGNRPILDEKFEYDTHLEFMILIWIYVRNVDFSHLSEILSISLYLFLCIFTAFLLNFTAFICNLMASILNFTPF